MEENRELLKDIFRLIKKNVCRFASFLYPVCAVIEFLPTEAETQPGALYTDGINIYYQPEKVMALYKERQLSKLEQELMHILLHGMLGHFEFWKGIDHQELFDFCTDVEVERLMKRLKPDKEKRKASGEKMVGWREMYAQHLHRINQGKTNLEAIKNRSHLEELDEHTYWKREKTEKVKQAWEERLQMAFLGMTSKEEEGSESRFQMLVQSSGKDRGEDKGNSSQKVKAMSEGSFEFKAILEEILEITEKAKEEEERFDRGLYYHGFDTYGDVALLEPSDENEDKQKLDTIVIAIDTSGSCQGELVEKFLRETKKLFRDIGRNYTVDNIFVMQCDTAIRQELKYTSVEEFLRTGEMELKGFGGTDFRPVFKRVEEIGKENKVNCLIYFSDGNGTFPKQEAPFKTAFIMEREYDGRNLWIPAWIKTYYFNEG